MAGNPEKALDAASASAGPLRHLMAHNDVIFALGVAMVQATQLVPLRSEEPRVGKECT